MHTFFIRNISNIVENIKDWIRRYKWFLILELSLFVLSIILAVSLVVKNTNCLQLQKLTSNNLYCFLIGKASFFHFFFCSFIKFSFFIILNSLCFCNRYLKYISLLIVNIFVFKIFYDIALIICLLGIVGVAFSILCLLLFYILILKLIIILQMSLLEKLDNQCGDFNFCYNFSFIGYLILCLLIIIFIQSIIISIFLPILNLFV